MRSNFIDQLQLFLIKSNLIFLFHWKLKTIESLVKLKTKCRSVTSNDDAITGGGSLEFIRFFSSSSSYFHPTYTFSQQTHFSCFSRGERHTRINIFLFAKSALQRNLLVFYVPFDFFPTDLKDFRQHKLSISPMTWCELKCSNIWYFGAVKW